MDKQPRPGVSVICVADDGTEFALNGSGVRVPIGARAWAAVDFERARDGTPRIAIAGRARGGANLPGLLIRPICGNIVDFLFGTDSPGEPLALRALPVSRMEPAAMLEKLATTTSGDPPGEEVLDQATQEPVNARRFHVAHGELAVVQITLAAGPFAALVINVTVNDLHQSEPRHAGLSMTLHPHAGNLVSLAFAESTFVRAEALGSTAAS
jgi:hypothetical protein